MKQRRARGDTLGLLGVGAVACAACCGGPLLAVLGGLSLAGVAATVVLGAAGLVLALAALVAYLVVRRRQRRTLAPVANRRRSS